MYHELCGELFDDWRNNCLAVSPEVRQAFDLKYCPEPYLLFGDQKAPITFVTLNPGGGEDFQRLENVGTWRSPIRANATYLETAADLGLWYASPRCPISLAARTRIKGMLELSVGLGRTGIEQLESIPFHSVNIVNASRVDRDPVLARYRGALSHYIADRDLVCAMAGGRADGSGVHRIAEIIGMDQSNRNHLGFTMKNGDWTSGVVFSKQERHVRAVFYRQGSLGLPSKEHLARIRSALL